LNKIYVIFKGDVIGVHSMKIGRIYTGPKMRLKIIRKILKLTERNHFLYLIILIRLIGATHAL